MEKIDSIKNGDLMSFTHFVKVFRKNNNMLYGHTLDVYDIDNENDFTIKGTELIKTGFSADVYDEEERVTKTRLAELLSEAYGKPFTVCFVKSSGEERVLRGRLVGVEKLMGRSQVEDLDLEKGKNFRLVCHRTLRWLIIDNTKFLLKK